MMKNLHKIFFLAILFSILPNISLATTQTFTSNNTFVVPVGVTTVSVNMSGGGGGGQEGIGSTFCYMAYSSGGGGGAAAISGRTIAVTSQASMPVVVGVAGNYVYNNMYMYSPYTSLVRGSVGAGGKGGYSSFGGLTTAGGFPASDVWGGSAGGAGGSNGANMDVDNGNGFGGGGNSLFGVGGQGAVTGYNNPIASGSGYGAGGGGGLCDEYTAGNGSPGFVQITYTIPTFGTVAVSSNISSSWTINGPATITGSGTSQSSASQPIGTYTITWGAVAGYTTPTSQSFSLATGATITFNGTYTVLASCTLPWGGSIASGNSATAYQSPLVTSPTTCASVSESRTCTNGTLSGTYTNQSCAVASSCTLPWGGSIASGASTPAYLFSSVPSPTTCASVSQTRTCSNGTLSGTYANQSCVVVTSCNLPWGGTLASGSSVTAYQSSSVTSPATCASVSQARTCNSGTLSGTYTNQSCTAGGIKTKFQQF